MSYLEKQSFSAVDYVLYYIIIKLCVSEQEAANKKIADSKTEIKTLKEVETLTEEKTQLSSGN